MKTKIRVANHLPFHEIEKRWGRFAQEEGEMDG
jgi:hypothetical protein